MINNKSHKRNVRVRLKKGGKYGDCLIAVQIRGKPITENGVEYYEWIICVDDLNLLNKLGDMLKVVDDFNNTEFSIKNGLNDFSVKNGVNHLAH